MKGKDLIFIIPIIFLSFLNPKSQNYTHWSLKIFFDTTGRWLGEDGRKINYELKILFEGWLFKDNGDYGISYLKDYRQNYYFYWKAVEESNGERKDLTENLKPYFDNLVSLRNGYENLILVRILIDRRDDFPGLTFPSSKGFENFEKSYNYGHFLIYGENKISFKDSDLKGVFFVKKEWEWKRVGGKGYCYHKVKTLTVIKPEN
ncbi:MAG: hypothetical protein ACUVUG_07365 [Candidatus Aminicenantia bacterium]